MRYPVLLLTLMLSGLAVAAPTFRPAARTRTRSGRRAGPGRRACGDDQGERPGTVVEYRANGKLYMLKVTPKGGRPYYLIDRIGDGQFVRQGDLGANFQPPMWVLIEF